MEFPIVFLSNGAKNYAVIYYKCSKKNKLDCGQSEKLCFYENAIRINWEQKNR